MTSFRTAGDATSTSCAGALRRAGGLSCCATYLAITRELDPVALDQSPVAMLEQEAASQARRSATVEAAVAEIQAFEMPGAGGSGASVTRPLRWLSRASTTCASTLTKSSRRWFDVCASFELEGLSHGSEQARVELASLLSDMDVSARRLQKRCEPRHDRTGRSKAPRLRGVQLGKALPDVLAASSTVRQKRADQLGSASERVRPALRGDGNRARERRGPSARDGHRRVGDP